MIITGNAHFESVCHKKLVEWYQENYPEKNATEANVFTVWLCKTLQNYKCLVSTNFAGDGIYAEYTYNGDKQELYEDVYRKVQNQKHIGSFGDSITIDEIQKKYEEYKQQTFSNLQSETINPTYGDNCWARLPCGICRNTMMNCPLSLMQPAWTCSSSTATNQTGGDA